MDLTGLVNNLLTSDYILPLVILSVESSFSSSYVPCEKATICIDCLPPKPAFICFPRLFLGFITMLSFCKSKQTIKIYKELLSFVGQVPATCTRLKSPRVNCSWDQSPQSNGNHPHSFDSLQNIEDIESTWCSLECYLALTSSSKIISRMEFIEVKKQGFFF